MKTTKLLLVLIALSLFLAFLTCYPQDKPIILHPRADWDTNANFERDKNLCKERGHIMPSAFFTTAIICPDRIEEYADSTVIVHVGCNMITYKCMRCLQEVKEYEQTTREVIWRKEK